DHSFDVVFSFQVLEHIPPDELPKAISEIARVTKPDGKIIVSVPSTVRPLSKAHFQHFTPASIAEALSSSMQVESVVGQDLRTPVRWLVERLLQNRLYTLEALAARFNRTTYLRRYNRTSAERGDNLIVVATPK
ncbi:class I SAM-dependent methyltransferase, partial [Candidatus Kaiserbacteria bacterium]|nr:class I SAM-dependent methyltransferase [Candidatus Kaiserbacteria bacterium]